MLPITLYIPCYNAERFLDRVLPAVKTQTYPIARVLVIDDGSTDRTAELAEGHGFEVIRHDGNRGLGSARNTALRTASTEFVACLDADVVARPDWLERLAANFDDDRYVGASGQLHESVLDSLADRWRDAHMRQDWGAERIEDPEFLYGNNGLYRRQALIDAGLYDERCRTNGEDVSMSESLRERGQRVVYDPTAECEHLRSDDIESICRTYWNWHFFNEDLSDRASLERVKRRARKRLLKKYMRGDFKRGRFDLAGLDLYMYVDWRRRAAARFRAAETRRGPL